MKKYEEMLQNLDEQNRRIVLEAMQDHDNHYQAVISWSKCNYVKWQKIYSVMAGIYLGVKDVEDLYHYLDAISEDSPNGDSFDFQYMICEGSTVARVMYEKYNHGKSGKELYREELLREYKELCYVFGFDHTIEDFEDEIKYLNLTQGQISDMIVLASGLNYGKEYEFLKRILKEKKYYDYVEDL